MSAYERIVTTSGGHNCGGRCFLDVHVAGNRVTRITGSMRTFGSDEIRLSPCVRCGSYLERLYDPRRLKYPLRRTGRRGEGKFERISWKEAVAVISCELKRITETYGPRSRYVHYSTGIKGRMAEREFFRRLLSIYGGGYLNYYNSYSTACTTYATPYTYGTAETGSSRDTWLHSKLIILWGHNPAETVNSTGTMGYLKQAREKGAGIIVIDPRRSDTVKALADQWIPVLPTTDNALMDAMTWVILAENLYDRDFVDRYCVGFDEEHMPPGIPPGNSLVSYILGRADGIEKTPDWAAGICGVSAETIRQLARDFALSKPAALVQGFGPQRHAYGEQPVRGGTVLAAITGNVGIPGGWASGLGSYRPVKVASVPFSNPVTAAIPVFQWTEALARGEELTAADGLTGAEKLDSSIKFIANLAGNTLVNQHSDINRTRELLADESKCEFILASDEFLTPSTDFADIVLPSTNFLERIDIIESDDFGEYAVFMNKAVEPEFERRTGYDWIAEIADSLGVGGEFTGGRAYDDWAPYIVAETRRRDPDFPDYATFVREGIYYPERKEPHVAFRSQIEDPVNNPFPTPSGRIEIFSERLYRMNNPAEIPAVPGYIPAWEGPDDPLRDRFPLQLIGWHSKRSTHSTFANLNRAEKIVPMELWMNPSDAKPRGIQQGSRVRVFNGRGEVLIPVKLTEDIMAGVVAMPQGGWFRKDEEGSDGGASINTLTRQKPTPLAKGNPQHTNLVQVLSMQDSVSREEQ